MNRHLVSVMSKSEAILDSALVSSVSSVPLCWV